MALEVKHLFSWDTEYSADSAEFCPIPLFEDYLAVGTYQLADPEKALDTPEEGGGNPEADSSEAKDVPKKRLGRLYLKQKIKDKLCLVQKIDMPAILDMKWCQHEISGTPMLAIVNAVGQLLLYRLIRVGEEVCLEYHCKYEIEEEETLALSLDWSTGKTVSESPLISVSDSKGNVSIIQLTNGELVLQNRFFAHDFEAWITAFDYWNPNTVFTGGDDCKFRRFDIRAESATPVFTSRVHNAGVTSIHSNCHSEHLLASGSYDETVNLWDTRNMRSPCSSTSLGGGVWRLKWQPQGKSLLLCACMYNGFHVIDTKSMETVVSFNEHQSIAYGVDWFYGMKDSTQTVASASFYDHLLCLWEFKD